MFVFVRRKPKRSSRVPSYVARASLQIFVSRLFKTLQTPVVGLHGSFKQVTISILHRDLTIKSKPDNIYMKQTSARNAIAHR